MIRDYCDVDSECISSFCSNNECQIESIFFPKWMLIVGLVSLILVTMGLFITFYCLK